MKRKIYIFLLSITLILPAIASQELIEMELSECLNNQDSNYEMAICTQKARIKYENEIKNIKELKINNNTKIWNNYCNSVNNIREKTLDNSDGNFYKLLSEHIIYELNKNRLLFLNYFINNNNYSREKYISEELEKCLNNASSDYSISTCYYKESRKIEHRNNKLEKDLKKLLNKNLYQDLVQNKKTWNCYKKNNIYFMDKNNSIPQFQIKKAQITKIMNEEYNIFLSDINLLYNQK